MTAGDSGVYGLLRGVGVSGHTESELKCTSPMTAQVLRGLAPDWLAGT